MKIRFLQFILFLAVTSVSLSAQPYLIGHRTMNFTDPARNDRPVPSEVFYPAETAGNNTICSEGAFPVIVFGHGFLMTYDAYLYLKDALVPLGYIITFEDCVTPPSQHQIPMYDSLASDCKVYISIKGGGHCYFGDYNFLCSLGEMSCQQNFTITREQQHAVVLDFLVPYLNYTLKNDEASWILFNDSLASSSRITYEKSCTTTQLEKHGNNQQYRIFPNPASDHFFIGFPENHERTVQIVIRSLTGNIVFKEKLSDGLQDRSRAIDISKLPHGFYIIEIIRPKDYFHLSFIKRSL